MTTPAIAQVFQLPVHLAPNYVTLIQERINQGEGGHVVTLNAEIAMLCQQDPQVRSLITAADVVVPDGAGIILYLKWRGKTQKRCPGIELSGALVELAAAEGWKVAFLGGKPEIAAQSAQAWQTKFPQLQFIAHHGYLSDEEITQWQRAIAEFQPQLILVGLGVPRQELWIRENRPLVPHGTWIGVGGSFDIWSGQKKRAPDFFCRYHLEWLYRLYQEPWRWRRMLVLPVFFWKALTYRDPKKPVTKA